MALICVMIKPPKWAFRESQTTVDLPVPWLDCKNFVMALRMEMDSEKIVTQKETVWD